MYKSVHIKTILSDFTDWAQSACRYLNKSMETSVYKLFFETNRFLTNENWMILTADLNYFDKVHKYR